MKKNIKIPCWSGSLKMKVKVFYNGGILLWWCIMGSFLNFSTFHQVIVKKYFSLFLNLPLISIFPLFFLSLLESVQYCKRSPNVGLRKASMVLYDIVFYSSPPQALI